jgi:hypothetical protein
MYCAVSVRDIVRRFLNEDPLGDQFVGITDDRNFGELIVKVADRLDERLKHLGWNSAVVQGHDPESLAAMSIRCLRTLGPALWEKRGDSIVHQQAFFTLLMALTSLLEQSEHPVARNARHADAPRVRIRRFLSSPDEITDPHAPREPGEEIGRY